MFDAARKRQRERLRDSSRITNADMIPREVREHCQLDSEGKSLLRSAMEQLHLSARSYHRVLKLSRTIADLSGKNEIRSTHIAESLQYQPRGQI